MRLKWIVIVSLLTACIEKVDLHVPSAESFLVVEGLITDQPGPYTVKVTRSFAANKRAFSNSPVEKAKVSLYADEFLLGDLVETSAGVYETIGITGIVGRTYYITIETREGKHYVSDPELLKPVGTVKAIRAEFESRVVRTADGEKNGDRFSIYVDGNTTQEPESFVRWRVTGTYLLRTNPEFAYNVAPTGAKIPTPPECSGYMRGGTSGIAYFGPCTCCTCWITEPAKLWTVAASRDVNQDGYKNVFVGQVAVNNLTFMDRYHVEVEQMSISHKAYEFLRQLTAQAEGVQSLFQPATGAIKGNINAIDSDETVLGLFYASSIKSNSIFLSPKDVPYTFQEPDTIPTPCTTFRGSTNIQPDFW